MPYSTNCLSEGDDIHLYGSSREVVESKFTKAVWRGFDNPCMCWEWCCYVCSGEVAIV